MRYTLLLVQRYAAGMGLTMPELKRDRVAYGGCSCGFIKKLGSKLKYSGIRTSI